ncbi:MAG: hypothetical protein HYT08_02545 [Candidatus Levybacteria bacterium]|nr:hypothetical protein [Candidatus Levybacteria bacterium]
MNNNSGGSRFFDGFLWGLIIGGGLMFLLGTKKGKKFLKMISEEGIGNISELLKEQADEEEEYEEEPEEEVVSSGNGTSNPIRSGSNGESQSNVEDQKKPQSLRRRFFKRR